MRESGKNYIKTIFTLNQKYGRVKSVDVARELGFAKPSVSRAVKLLKEGGYLTVEEGGYLKLTQKGEELAGEIADKHEYVREYLVRILHLSGDIAETEALKIEHVIGPETYYEMKNAVVRHKKMFDKID